MPDITMCLNKKCKSRKDCYRFVATPDTYQSYVEFKPLKNSKCKYKLELPPYWNKELGKIAMPRKKYTKIKMYKCGECGALSRQKASYCPVCFLKDLMDFGEKKNWGIK